MRLAKWFTRYRWPRWRAPWEAVCERWRWKAEWQRYLEDGRRLHGTAPPPYYDKPAIWIAEPDPKPDVIAELESAKGKDDAPSLGEKAS